MSILLDDRVIRTGTLIRYLMNLIPVCLIHSFQWVMTDQTLLRSMVVHALVTSDIQDQRLHEPRLVTLRSSSWIQCP
jgi:hypothetical protein